MASDENSSNTLDPTGKFLGDYIEFWWHVDGSVVQRLMNIWLLAKPVIAAVSGYAVGCGFWYQIACDITVASDPTRFCAT